MRTTMVDDIGRAVLRRRTSSTATRWKRIAAGRYEMGAIMPFAIRVVPRVGVERYRRGHDLASALGADAARLLTAILRADRFSEGTIAPAIDDGTTGAAVCRLRQWCDERQAPR